MSDANTITYCRQREARERALAARAISGAIAAIHRDMAERYSRLIEQASSQSIRA